MNAQTLTTSAIFCNFVVAIHEEEQVYAPSRDYGFDFDEEELAHELIAPLPASLADQPIPEVEANEFESFYQYFLS